MQNKPLGIMEYLKAEFIFASHKKNMAAALLLSIAVILTAHFFIQLSFIREFVKNEKAVFSIFSSLFIDIALPIIIILTASDSYRNSNSLNTQKSVFSMPINRMKYHNSKIIFAFLYITLAYIFFTIFYFALRSKTMAVLGLDVFSPQIGLYMFYNLLFIFFSSYTVIQIHYWLAFKNISTKKNVLIFCAISIVTFGLYVSSFFSFLGYMWFNPYIYPHVFHTFLDGLMSGDTNLFNIKDIFDLKSFAFWLFIIATANATVTYLVYKNIKNLYNVPFAE